MASAGTVPASPREDGQGEPTVAEREGDSKGVPHEGPRPQPTRREGAIRNPPNPRNFPPASNRGWTKAGAKGQERKGPDMGPDHCATVGGTPLGRGDPRREQGGA